MKTRIIIILITLSLLLVSSITVEAEVEYTLRFSDVGVPTDAHISAMYVFEDILEKITDGKIEVEIYHSGSLYPQDTQFDAMRRGNLEMGFTGSGTMSEYIPYLTMFTAGYFFKDYEHMTQTLNGAIGEKVFNDVAQKSGVRPLVAFYLGSRQLNLIGDKKIETPEDMKGVKLRMPTSPAWLFLGRALGANPTPLAFSELYMALNSGTVDGQDNPLPTIQNAKFYEVTDQIILTNHIIDSVWPSINEELWQKMGPELQRKVKIAIEEAREYCDETNLKRESELVEFFKSKGLKVYSPDINAFKEHVQQVYLQDEELTSSWDMGLYAEVQAISKHGVK